MARLRCPPAALGVALIVLFTAARAADYLVLSNFSLIDGTGAGERPVQSLTVIDGIIVDIDGAAQFKTPRPLDQVTAIDLDGTWLLPGLIDTHVHVARFPDTRAQAESILASALRGGITAVRDLGGDARALGELSRAQVSGEWSGPTIVYAAIFGGPALFEDPRIATLAAGHDPGAAPWARMIDASTDLALAVAAARGAGVAGIKLYAALDGAQVAGIAEQARRQSLASWAHATVFPAGPGELVAAGVTVLSHAPYLVWEAASQIPDDYAARTRGAWQETPVDHPAIRALFEQMAERGVLLDATLYIYQQMHTYSPEVQADWAAEALAWGARATALAQRMGVRVTAGTDWFEPRQPGGLPHTHDELALLVEAAGFTPLEAIVAGTGNGAAALGIADESGTVEIGKAADLLVLAANPLEDIRNTSQIRLVIKRGVIVRP